MRFLADWCMTIVAYGFYPVAACVLSIPVLVDIWRMVRDAKGGNRHDEPGA